MTVLIHTMNLAAHRVGKIQVARQINRRTFGKRVAFGNQFPILSVNQQSAQIIGTHSRHDHQTAGGKQNDA